LIGNNASKPQIVKTAVQVESQSDKKERGKAFRQVLAAFIVNIGTINTGLIFGWSAVAIPQLMRSDSRIQVDEAQASWIGERTKQIQLNRKFIRCLRTKFSWLRRDEKFN
jgi:hypothetical protein